MGDFRSSDDTREQEIQGEVVSDALISSVQGALAENQPKKILQLIEPLVPADVAFLLERLHPENRQKLLHILHPKLEGDVLPHLSPAVLVSVVDIIGIPRLAVLLPELDSDDAFAILEELDEQQQQMLLRAIPKENRLSFEKLMTYPEDSAARILQQEVVIAPSFWTVGALVQYVQRAEGLPEEFYEIYVVNPKHEPIGKIPLNQLLRVKPQALVSEIMNPDIHALSATMKQEAVAYAFRHYDLVSAPVVDEANRIIGMITADDVVDVMDVEAQKEMKQLAGVENADINAPILLTSYHRMAGLLVTFVNSFILAIVVYHYEHLIEQRVALVGLMPIVAGLSGAMGTQVIAVTVRSLSNKMISSANTWRIIGKEAAIGSINGLFFSVVLMIILMFWYEDWSLGLILIGALIFNMTWAAFSGVALPIMVDRLGLDPAVSTGPVLTAITDVIGFVSLLALASVFL